MTTALVDDDAESAASNAHHNDGPLLHRGEALIARVRRDHAIIHTLLDEVERACVVVKERRGGAVESLRRAVWDLDLTFEAHLDMEEAEVAPILRRSVVGAAHAVAMVLEHNDQRRVILELLEDTEREVKDGEALVAEAVALVQAFRADMALEDSALASLLTPGST